MAKQIYASYAHDSAGEFPTYIYEYGLKVDVNAAISRITDFCESEGFYATVFVGNEILVVEEFTETFIGTDIYAAEEAFTISPNGERENLSM